MFWMWREGYKFMDTEPGKHDSQTERISQELFARTFWGDYGGSILTRYYYDAMLRLAPEIVTSIDAAHGQGLVLRWFGKEGHGDEMRQVLEFLAAIREHDYWDDDDFSQFEYELQEKELAEGWTGESLVSEWKWALNYITEDWDHIIPEQGTPEFFDALTLGGDDWPEMYFETADSLVVHRDTDDVVLYLLSKVGPSYEQEEKLYG